MYLVFDTETNGLPKDYKAPMTDVDNFPRIIQFGYVVFSDSGEIVKEYQSLIYPDGWVIPNEKFWRDNGFTTERNFAEGVDIKVALAGFIDEINNGCHTLVAHNLQFDHKIVGAEMIRAGMFAQKKLNKICTMQSTIELCNLPGKYGPKFPKLVELHNKLFGVGFDGAHDALADVKATGRCLFKLLDMKHPLKF
jgi:DNA polymerase-3 subunit epsilon